MEAAKPLELLGQRLQPADIWQSHSVVGDNAVQVTKELQAQWSPSRFLQ